jgi:CUG-BP- and ETR3-like factor
MNCDENFLPVSAASQQMQEHVVVSITINGQQLAMINSHVFSVQSMSMAQLSVSSGPPGFFHLVVSGSKDQVETAKNLLGSILSPA